MIPSYETKLLNILYSIWPISFSQFFTRKQNPEIFVFISIHLFAKNYQIQIKIFFFTNSQMLPIDFINNYF